MPDHLDTVSEGMPVTFQPIESSGEVKLMRAVIGKALEDLGDKDRAPEVKAWVRSIDFLRVCDLAGWDHRTVAKRFKVP